MYLNLDRGQMKNNVNKKILSPFSFFRPEGRAAVQQAGALPPPADFHLFFRFRFFDLWIKFGKIMVKVCCCFNSAAKSWFALPVRSPKDVGGNPSPAAHY